MAAAAAMANGGGNGGGHGDSNAGPHSSSSSTPRCRFHFFPDGRNLLVSDGWSRWLHMQLLTLVVPLCSQLGGLIGTSTSGVEHSKQQ